MAKTKTNSNSIANTLDLWDCEDAAYTLFKEITDRHGVAQAQRIFMKFGQPPTQRKRAKIKNYGLLDRYDLMKPPNATKLARELAAENKKLPRTERRGSGSTNPTTLLRHLRRLIRERKNSLKAGKAWGGPITEEMAAQYYGA